MPDNGIVILNHLRSISPLFVGTKLKVRSVTLGKKLLGVKVAEHEAAAVTSVGDVNDTKDEKISTVINNKRMILLTNVGIFHHTIYYLYLRV